MSDRPLAREALIAHFKLQGYRPWASFVEGTVGLQGDAGCFWMMADVTFEPLYVVWAREELSRIAHEAAEWGALPTCLLRVAMRMPCVPGMRESMRVWPEDSDEY